MNINITYILYANENNSIELKTVLKKPSTNFKTKIYTNCSIRFSMLLCDFLGFHFRGMAGW